MRSGLLFLICLITVSCATSNPVRAKLPLPTQIISWQSDTTGDSIKAGFYKPETTNSDAPTPLVIYLVNLSSPRVGMEETESILTDLISEGYRVLVLDYRSHPLAKSPELHADLLKLRQNLGEKERKLLAEHKIDVNQVYILPEGYRLKRNIEFARDGSRVLAMDVMYPSRPRQPVPMLMEITCDNASRMGNFSLVFCRDTLVEGALLNGFAAAMVDHPVAPPYKGLDDPMPQSLDRMMAAVTTLRQLSPSLHGNGKIGAIGFSRGGPFAAMLAVQELNRDARVQAALIHGNRYDYLHLDPEDPMLARFTKAWGPLESNRDKWAIHGASHYLGKDPAPMFLNTSDTESPEYRKGLADFAERLRAMNAPFVYQMDQDGRGHRVSSDPKTLAAIYAFFHQYLDN